MRNWNKAHADAIRTEIEQRFYRTYEELKFQNYYADGQAWKRSFYRTYEELKLKPLCNRPVIQLGSFYRTYEELKFDFNIKLYKPASCFYRTYEELKLLESVEGTAAQNRFYRTYEELKWQEVVEGVNPPYRVFIVPMRNWNCFSMLFVHRLNPRFYRTYEELKSGLRRDLYFWILRFLSYLWGIEISFWSSLSLLCHSFLSYLWGIEIEIEFGIEETHQSVFIVPMRNWNHFDLASLVLLL